jgi:hypothetical protein
MTEKRIIVLGTIQIPELGESIAFDLPKDLDPAKITEALEKLEADRAAAAHAESEKLRKMFLTPTGEDEPENKPKDEPQ